MRFLSASHIISNASDLTNKVVVTDDIKIIDIINQNEVEQSKVEHLNGTLVPGFINTHCHLELSYLKNKIASGKGLDTFIKEIEENKQQFSETVLDYINKANEEMFANGIVAVGDICNTNYSFTVKANSSIYYHSFVEVYAFNPTKASIVFANGKQLCSQLEELNQHYSIVPHAPYSVSDELFKLINETALHEKSILSVHNQETKDENLFFSKKEGSILKRLETFGINTDHFKATGKSSIQSYLNKLPSENKILLVHNTETNQQDIDYAKQLNNNLFWCFCPNANLYIENKLPNFDLFIANNCNITLGTDSYASNWSLSIWDEIKAIQKNAAHIPLEQLIKWGCLNGAKLLGIDSKYGSIEIGKSPGLNLINEENELKKII